MSDRGAAGSGPPADPRDAEGGGGNGAGASDAPPTAEERLAEDAERPTISLDRYFTQRKPVARVSVTHVITIVLMLGALVMIFSFKNRCGLMVANMFEQVAGPASRPVDRKPGIPVENPR